MVQIQQYTWQTFDRDITILASKLQDIKFDLIYGNPRGGLPVAVALSHKLEVGLTTDPTNTSNVLWVDDIIDSGTQLIAAKQLNYAGYCALLNRSTAACHCLCAQIIDHAAWIVFPWENSDTGAATKDYESWRCQ